jgi:hypothetical protein
MVGSLRLSMGQGKSGLFAVERWTIRLAPALGMAAIAASALVMTEPEARWARLYTGPTDQPGPLVWRVAAKRGTPDRPQPAASKLALLAQFGESATVTREFSTDSEGIAWVRLERPTTSQPGPIAITLREGAFVLASGTVNVEKQRWLTGQRNEGGWCSGHSEGDVAIKVGVVEGVILHAVPAGIVVALSKDGRPLPRQPFSVEVDGAIVEGSQAPGRALLVSDERGLGHFSVRSTDMVAMLSVTVQQPHASRFVGALPIRAGGLHVARRGDALIIGSLASQSQATVGLLTENGLVDVRTIQLAANSLRMSATLNYPSWPTSPFWAIVSSETELDTGNTIGWPMLAESERGEAHASHVVPNLLVLDGYPTVTWRLEQQRHRAWYTSFSALVFVAALLAWVIVRSNRRNQAQVRQLSRLVEETGTSGVADPAPYATIAVIVLTAASVAIAWWLALGLR